MKDRANDSLILRDHSKSKIIEAMELNISGWALLLPKENPNYEITDSNDILLYKNTIELNHPLANYVLRVRLSEENAEKRINEVMKYFFDKKIAMMWFVMPRSTPSNLTHLLAKTGLDVPDEGSPAMVYDLRKLGKNDYQEIIPNSNVSIKKIESKEDVKIWGEIFAEGFSVPDKFIKLHLDVWPHFVQSSYFNYIAFSKGIPVAISSVIYYGGVAGIFNVVTLPKYRGQGFGTAITLAPLIDAKKRGYEIAWLGSSPMGFNVYKNIGFEEYGKMITCTYIPENKSS